LTEPGAADPAPGSPLARFVTWNVSGNAASLLIGFIASIALARWLGPSNRGLLALMLSVATLALVLTAIGMPVAVVYFASRRERDGPAILGNCLAHAAVLAAVLVPAALIFNKPLSEALGHGHGGRTWALAAALVPITFLDWTTHSQLQGTLRFGRFNVLLVLQRISYAVGVLILLGVLKLGVAAGLLATAIGSIVMIAGSLPPILKLGRPRLDRALMRRMMAYGGRAQIGSILQQTNARLDVIILQFFRPLSQVGYYVVAQTVAELLIQIADAFQWSNMALVSREDREDEQAERSTTAIRHHALISGVAALGNAIFGPVLIWFAYGPRFHDAIVPMLILLPGVWLLGIGFVVQGDLGGRGRPGMSSAMAGVSAAVTVVLDLALIPAFGVDGAAVASVCAYATFGVGSLIALHRVSGVSVRELAVPTRADLHAYARFITRAAGALRSRRRSHRGAEAEPRGRGHDPRI
jgi:O-antigen/teichoic acid export membrane protein